MQLGIVETAVFIGVDDCLMQYDNPCHLAFRMVLCADGNDRPVADHRDGDIPRRRNLEFALAYYVRRLEELGRFSSERTVLWLIDKGDRRTVHITGKSDGANLYALDTCDLWRDHGHCPKRTLVVKRHCGAP